jgi:hypothetical protein
VPLATAFIISDRAEDTKLPICCFVEELSPFFRSSFSSLLRLLLKSPRKLVYAEVEEMVFPVGCVAKNGGLLDTGHVT